MKVHGWLAPANVSSVPLSLIRKLPVRNESEIRFKSAVRHISTPAPSVPESALNSANLAAALPFPFHVSVAAVLSHLVFTRVISDIEIDSGVTVTSGRGRVLLRESVHVSAAGGAAPAQDWRPQDVTPDLQRAMTKAGRDNTPLAFAP